MLFFRSEEMINEWCEANFTLRQPTIEIDQLWNLSVEWYSNRLTPDARRPGPDEMREIFARHGLTGPFWDPKADQFG